MVEADIEVPVIIGGSIVGMFAAALLGQEGVKPLVVERHRGTAIHPRAALIYQKSMQIVRGLTHGMKPFVPDPNVDLG